MRGYDGASVFMISSSRCSRCARPSASHDDIVERTICVACLRAADADIAAKRSILLPQPEPGADALSAVF